MKISCDFCDAEAYGTQPDLFLAGWVRAVFSAPERITISACPKHCKEWTERVNEIFTAAKVGNTKIPFLEDELEELMRLHEGAVGIELKRIDHKISELQRRIDNQR